MNYNQSGMKLENDDTGYFIMYMLNNNGEQILTTNNSKFSVMEHYQLWEFGVDAKSVYGISDGANFLMETDKNYSMWAQQSASANESAESIRHPFVVVQLNSGDYFGMVLFNTQYNKTYTWMPWLTRDG